MTSKRLLLCLLASIAFFAVGFIVLSFRTGPRINQASFDRIQKGMTEAEVVEILGGPPGDYGPGMEFMPATSGCIEHVPARTEQRWSFGSVAIAVWFNATGIAVEKEWESGIVRFPPPVSNLKKLRNWFKSAFSRWL